MPRNGLWSRTRFCATRSDHQRSEDNSEMGKHRDTTLGPSARELNLCLQKYLRSVVFEEVLLIAVEAAGVDRFFALYAHSSQ